MDKWRGCFIYCLGSISTRFDFLIFSPSTTIIAKKFILDLNFDDEWTGRCTLVSTESDGLWFLQKCIEPHSFICEYPRHGYTNPPTTTTTVAPEAQCEGPEWTKVNDHCYRYFNNISLNFATAEGENKDRDFQNPILFSLAFRVLSYQSWSSPITFIKWRRIWRRKCSWCLWWCLLLDWFAPGWRRTR